MVFGEGWKDPLLIVIPSYVSKYKKPSPSSIIQESHRIPFYLSFWFIAKRKLKSNPFVSKEQGKMDWMLNLLTMEAINLGAKDSISISWLYLYVLISVSLIPNLLSSKPSLVPTPCSVTFSLDPCFLSRTK